MLPNVISQSPLIISYNSLQRTLHIILVTPPTDIRARPTHHRRITHATTRTLAPSLLLKPTPLRPRTRGVSVGGDGRSVLVGVHERGIGGAGCGGEVGGEAGEVVGVEVGGGVGGVVARGWDRGDFGGGRGFDELGVAVPLAAARVAAPTVLATAAVSPLGMLVKVEIN